MDTTQMLTLARHTDLELATAAIRAAYCQDCPGAPLGVYWYLLQWYRERHPEEPASPQVVYPPRCEECPVFDVLVALAEARLAPHSPRTALEVVRHALDR